MVDNKTINTQRGFGLLEILVVLAVLAIITSMAYSNYQNNIVSTRRAEIMSELQNIASELESQKMLQGNYKSIDVTPFKYDFPEKTPLYKITVEPTPLTSQWTVKATPKSDQIMKDDGTVTLDFNGVKCRGNGADKKCGTGDNWRK